MTVLKITHTWVEDLQNYRRGVGLVENAAKQDDCDVEDVYLHQCGTWPQCRRERTATLTSRLELSPRELQDQTVRAYEHHSNADGQTGIPLKKKIYNTLSQWINTQIKTRISGVLFCNKYADGSDATCLSFNIIRR
jgi:hypothetical protein